MKSPALRSLTVLALAVTTLTLTTGAIPLPAPLAAAPARATTTYAFADEFTGTAGSLPSSRWSFQTGGNGWGNGELQQYTARATNAHLDGSGHLAVVVRRETYTGSDGITRYFTSARLFTSAPISYGYAEARILLPSGKGLWPAFWSLGANITSVGWPLCGEIDTLESINSMTSASGTIHGADTVKNVAYKYGVGTTPAGGLAGTWHTYAVSKTSSSFSWYLDGVKYGTVNRSSFTTGQQWPFDQSQYLLLNVAVGGTWPGAPDSTLLDGSTMLVDWVHAGAGLPPDATS